MTAACHPTRRRALIGALGVGVCVEFAAARAWAVSEAKEAGRKLVVIVCRGGLDGLSLSPPVGEAAYAALRGSIAIAPPGEAGGALALDGTFGLHPALTSIHALALKGQARIAPAVATPDRERSHFEAQDVLESGVTVAYGAASGWLNRAVEAMGPAGAVKALSMGQTAPLILRGPAPAATWSPGGMAERDARLPAILQDLYANDPLLGSALASGLATRSMAKTATAKAAMAPAGLEAGPDAAKVRTLGATLAGFMVQPAGPQVAAVSIDGFDTHANQGSGAGQLATRLAYVDAFIDGLNVGLGPSWDQSVVMLATEFGRTAAINGTKGTDHGTASTALLLGGAIRRGGIIGDWPTLAENRLYEARDLAPTLDMRALFKGVLRDHLGLERAKLDTLVFPGSAAVAPHAGLVA